MLKVEGMYSGWSHEFYDFTLQVPLQFPLKLRWRCGPDMVFRMGGYVQSVVVQGRVYVGGGNAGFGSHDNYIVMEYDISLDKWAKLPPYRAQGFAMAVINDQLVLVGGCEPGHYSKVLGVWRAESKEWRHPYSDMPTARSVCSAVVRNEWLAVAGGVGDGVVRLASVEVMNTDIEQWYTAPPMPIPWTEMKTAIVGDTCYFMGGFIESHVSATTVGYSVSLSALIPQLNSQDFEEGTQGRGGQHQLWKEIPGLGLHTTLSSPLSISGSLLAVGGVGEGHCALTAIHLYLPNTGEWVKVGDLPTPRYNCTCAMITDRRMLVAGGEGDEGDVHQWTWHSPKSHQPHAPIT